MRLSTQFTAMIVFGATLPAYATVARAATVAMDQASNAEYDVNWVTGDNGGTGFGPWTLTNGSNAGFFIDSSAGNGNGDSGGTVGDIDTGGEAFGLFGNSGGEANAVRPFTGGSLTVGQVFGIDMDNGFVQNGGTVGFSLQSSAGTNLFEFFFQGGKDNYTVNAANTSGDGTPGFTDEGLRLAFTLTDPDSFSLTIDNFADGVGVNNTVTGDLFAGTPQTISQVRLFNSNAGNGGTNNAFFNKLSVVPEPITVTGGTALLGLVMLRRQRAGEA